MSRASSRDPRSSQARWRQASNPFATKFIVPTVMRYRFADVSQIADRFLRCPHPMSIVGPHGTGKSTLVEELCTHLNNEFCRIVTYVLHTGDNGRGLMTSLKSLSPRTLVVIDGAEQMALARRWLLVKHCRQRMMKLLVTSHSRLSGFSVLHYTYTSLDQARQLTIDLMRLNPCLTQSAISHVERIWPTLNGNTRDLWLAMYDWYQTQTASNCSLSTQ